MQEDDEAILLRVLKNVGLTHAYSTAKNTSTSTNKTRNTSRSSQNQDAASSPDENRESTDRQLAPSMNTDLERLIPDTSPSAQLSGLLPPLPAGWKETEIHDHAASLNHDGNTLDMLDWDWNTTSDNLVHLTQTAETPSMPGMGARDPRSTTDITSQADSSTQPRLSSASDGEDSDAESTEELVDRLSDRVGSLQIGSDGHIRYYGPTSNFNLVQMPAPDNMTVHRTVRNDGQEYLNRLDIGKDVPQDIEEHLVNLYFTWQDPTSHVVQREMYENAKVQWRDGMLDTPYYSEALRNSICALGAAFESRHHPTFVTFPKALSDFFADRAKTLLDIELDCPSVATVQAMVILSGHDIGCMAMRLAFDMALHVDMTPYVKRGSVSQAEADLRKTVFWGAFTVDHLWGFHLGRPFRINMEDVTVEKPGSSQDNTISGTWSAYGSHRIPPSVLQDMNHKTVKALDDWKEALPPILQVDPDEPHNHARKACIDSAVAIAKILQIYEDRYTLRRMNIQGVMITCSAALLLIFATVSRINRPEYVDLGVKLSTCFRALDEFSGSWENAKRAHDFLVMLQREWEIRARSNRMRRQSSATGSSQTARKRLRRGSESEFTGNSYSPITGAQPNKRQLYDWAQTQPSAEALGTELGVDLDWIFGVENNMGPEALIGSWGP
ncbi:fungal specific transcription factor [Colletotrichum musicola]|uniref:Fungal specific transcription factor n=1 Tax=Colletotrichum musicola TaxID=2175873 RepID=A0A8H6KKX2_9PEZI|nr:fungal specific transcription factor [Colletotrichum musicola]